MSEEVKEQEIIVCDICYNPSAEKWNGCCGLKWCFNCDHKTFGLCYICKRDEINHIYKCGGCDNIITFLTSTDCRGCNGLYCIDCYKENDTYCGNPICDKKIYKEDKKEYMECNPIRIHPWDFMCEEYQDECNICNKDLNNENARLCHCCKEVYCSDCLEWEEEYEPPLDYGHVCKNRDCLIKFYLYCCWDEIENNPGTSWSDVENEEDERLIDDVIEETLDDIISQIEI